MNVAISSLKTDWCMTVQADEVVHERSFDNIRNAIEQDVDSYLCRRYNMWCDPLSHLVVEQSKKPCSDAVIRLARTKYRCFGDGESIMAPFTHVYGRPESMEIYHTGYVRDQIKNVAKSKAVLVDIFGMDMDKRIGDKFDYKNFPFQGNDIQPVPLPLPKYIKDWCRQRHPDAEIV